LNKIEKDKKEFRKNFEDFITYWEKEAEDIKNRELTEKDMQKIVINFDLAVLHLISLAPPKGSIMNADSFTRSDWHRLNLTESKLYNSLAKATSRYRSTHNTLLERLLDNIGGLCNLLSGGWRRW